MNRSLAFSTTLALACGLAGCRAQSERSALRTTVSKLEQQMESVDRAVAGMERDAARRAKQFEAQLADRDARILKLEQQLRSRSAELEQTRADAAKRAANMEGRIAEEQRRHEERAQAERAAAEAVTADIRAKFAAERERAAADRAALQAALDEHQRAVEQARAEAPIASARMRALEAQVAELTEQNRALEQARRREATEQRTRAPERDLAWLDAEREEIAALRAAIERDLASAPPRDGSAGPLLEQLRADNARLRARVLALEGRTAGAQGSAVHVHGGVHTMVIHADQGTVHVHVDEQGAQLRSQSRQMEVDASPRRHPAGVEAVDASDSAPTKLRDSAPQRGEGSATGRERGPQR